MKDICYIAAFPKSGITYLNFMLFYLLFDCPQDARLIDSHYIFDVHENLARVPPPSEIDRYVKIHFAFGPQIPLRQRAARAVYLLRDPIDVMMSVWDFKHLTGEEGLLDASPPQREALFQKFCQHWLSSGGLVYPWAGSWRDNVASWLEQKELPLLLVRYERLKAHPAESCAASCAFLVVKPATSASRRRLRPASLTICVSSNPKRSRPECLAFFTDPVWREVTPKATVLSGACTAVLRKKS